MNALGFAVCLVGVVLVDARDVDVGLGAVPTTTDVSARRGVDKTDVSARRGVDKTDVSARRGVDGVLSLLGVEVPGSGLASREDEDGDAKSKAGGPGERGIHRKKLHHHHLWHAFYWWAWVFAVIVVKFKVAVLLIWGHLSYFIMALIRMLIRELKRAETPPVYGPPPAQYGPQYGPQYGSGASSYSPYKRRAGTAGAAAEAAAGGGTSHDLAYAAHS